MRFPVGDWQFWIVTGAGIVALWYIARAIVPSLSRRRRRTRRATLTIEGRGIDDRRAGDRPPPA